MHIILGGTGHVGGATARALLQRGQPVTIVTRDAANAGAWTDRNASVEVADTQDLAALRTLFRKGQRLLIVNPPADPATDTDVEERATTDVEERATIATIIAALEGSAIEKVVAQSTYGAQPGERIGDLSTLYTLEQGLAAQPIPSSIFRAAYHMSNWDTELESARNDDVIHTLLPADLAIPMVAPADLGAIAADLLTGSVDRTNLRHVEGPARYSSADVAGAFARALDRPMRLLVTPRGDWNAAFRRLGFSPAAADAYTRMTTVSVDGDFAMPDHPIRGSIALDTYIADLVAGDRNDG